MLPIRAGSRSRFLPLDDACLPGAGDKPRRGQPRCFGRLCEVRHQLSDGDGHRTARAAVAVPGATVWNSWGNILHDRWVWEKEKGNGKRKNCFPFTKGTLHGLAGFWFDVIRCRFRPRRPREARWLLFLSILDSLIYWKLLLKPCWTCWRTCNHAVWWMPPITAGPLGAERGPQE